MTVAAVDPRGVARIGRGPVPAVVRRSFRQVRTGAIVCAVACGGTAASSALTYVQSFATAASRHQLVATTSTDTGLAILLGPVREVGTVGGYTVYKGFAFLTTIAALWALFAATRLLRGEEDAGRWHLVLAGATRPAAATLATLTALAIAVGVVFAGTVALTLAAATNPDVGFSLPDTLLYGATIAMPAAVFAGVGAVAAQLCRTRRAASGLGVVLFAVAFVVRMIADTGPALRWLRWATPLGWSELVAPYTQNRLGPLVPGVLATVVLGAVAVVLAGRRDVGSGILATADVSPPRPFGLGSPWGLALRLELPALAGWCAGVTATGLGLGVIAKMTSRPIPDSLQGTLDRFGVHGSFALQYLGVAFLLVAGVVALLPAGQIGAAGEEETAGRLPQVLAGATTRRAWFAGRLALTAAAVLVAGLLAGLAAWAGAASQGVDVGAFRIVGAGLNVVPTALLAMGLGAVVLAFAPRFGAAAVYGVVTWSLLVDLVGSVVPELAWSRRISIFHTMALAPARDPELTTLLVTTAIALALGVVATLVFERRDLTSA
ncbi:MAG: hypothetical protein ACXVK4_16610 [Acidimicrobiia bacterium]